MAVVAKEESGSFLSKIKFQRSPDKILSGLYFSLLIFFSLNFYFLPAKSFLGVFFPLLIFFSPNFLASKSFLGANLAGKIFLGGILPARVIFYPC